jgi:hypothetical protein
MNCALQASSYAQMDQLQWWAAKKPTQGWGRQRPWAALIHEGRSGVGSSCAWAALLGGALSCRL